MIDHNRSHAPDTVHRAPAVMMRIDGYDVAATAERAFIGLYLPAAKVEDLKRNNVHLFQLERSTFVDAEVVAGSLQPGEKGKSAFAAYAAAQRLLRLFRETGGDRERMMAALEAQERH